MLEIKQYKKQYDYSYSLGAFPTIELLKEHSKDIIKVFIHSSFSNNEVIKVIRKYTTNIEVNDKIINKLSDKENVYVIGVFNKYHNYIDKDSHHLVLVNPSNMGNLGTIIRSSLGFGIKDIAIIKPGVDCFDPKVIRSSMGSIFNINIEYFDSFLEYKNKFNNHLIYTFMLQANKALNETIFVNKLSSLVFGNEATGLDKDYLNDLSIIIEHSQDIDSLNLPTAVGIALYEFNKQIK